MDSQSKHGSVFIKRVEAVLAQPVQLTHSKSQEGACQNQFTCAKTGYEISDCSAAIAARMLLFQGWAGLGRPLNSAVTLPHVQQFQLRQKLVFDPFFFMSPVL